MARPPVLLSPVLPPAKDPAVTLLLHGLCRATGAHGSTLTLSTPTGDSTTYVFGELQGPRLVLQLQLADRLGAACALYGAGDGPAASPAALEAIQPLLQGALQALAERSNAFVQVDVLSQILGVRSDANLLMGPDGEILWANARGEDALARHTQRPQANLDGDTQAAPLLDLVVEHMRELWRSGERARRRVLTAWGGERWSIDLVALPGLQKQGCCLVALAPVRLPAADDLHQRLARNLISHREAEVLALVLEGHKASEIAPRLGITEYTVKDHLKHAYVKLGIRSRNQLLSRLALGSTGS